MGQVTLNKEGEKQIHSSQAASKAAGMESRLGGAASTRLYSVVWALALGRPPWAL